MGSFILQGLNGTHLGPYEKGGTSLTGGIKPVLVPLNLLAEGNNENKVSGNIQEINMN